MSWDAYVDQSLIGSTYIDKAAIYNGGGDVVWADPHQWSIPKDEMKKIVQAVDSADESITRLTVHGVGYMVHQTGERSRYARKGKEGIVVVKTKQALIITHYPDGVVVGNATNTVEKLADYMVKLGY